MDGGMGDPRRDLLEVSESLAGLSDGDSYVRAAGLGILSLIPGEDLFWLESNYEQGTCVMRHGEPLSTDPDLGHRMAQAYDHPAIQSYMQDRRDLSPRRLSDLASRSDFEKTRAHALLGDTMRAHQLGMMVRIDLSRAASGWVLARDDCEFSDDEVAIAAGLVAVLAAWERVYRPSQRYPRATDDDENRAGLSPRELQVLQLIALGLTAAACGHVLRISSATVRKHLEHVYDKLGTHDRLVAVTVAARMGLLGGGEVGMPAPPDGRRLVS